MANKTLKKKVQAKPAASKIASPVVDSVREILFAGLGAFSVVQQESGKLIEQGNKLFDKLVSEGAKLEKNTVDVAETAVDDLKHEVESQFDIARQQIVDNWDGLGNVFDERVSGTLDRLGIPTTKELNKLTGQVQKMSRQAVNNWKELEAAFEERVAGVLKNLHVPDADDVNQLSENMKKISSEAAANLGKLEKELEARVSGAIGDLEAATAQEIKILNAGVKDISDQVSENWDRLETVVEGRVTKILGDLGVANSDDLGKLSSELKKLTRQVAAMEKKLKAGTKTAPRKAAVKKPVPKAATTS